MPIYILAQEEMKVIYIKTYCVLAVYWILCLSIVQLTLDSDEDSDLPDVLAIMGKEDKPCCSGINLPPPTVVISDDEPCSHFADKHYRLVLKGRLHAKTNK